MARVRFFIPTLSNGWKQMRLNISLQDTGQPTHWTYPQWNTECMRFLKNFSNHRNAATKSELVKGAKEVWSEIKIRKIRRVIKSWPFRVDLMVQKLGFQISLFSVKALFW